MQLTSLLALGALVAGTCRISTGPIGGGRDGGAGGGGGPSTNQVFMQNILFNPSTLTVARGTTVTWVNKDPVDHTTTSNPGSGQPWHSGLLTSGGTFSVMFNTPGTYLYYCMVHATPTSGAMRGTIVVQ